MMLDGPHPTPRRHRRPEGTGAIAWLVVACFYGLGVWTGLALAGWLM